MSDFEENESQRSYIQEQRRRYIPISVEELYASARDEKEQNNCGQLHNDLSIEETQLIQRVTQFEENLVIHEKNTLQLRQQNSENQQTLKIQNQEIQIQEQQNMIKMESQNSNSSKGGQQCRICYDSSEQNGKLISPCNCTGSVKYVHEDCLKTWLLTQQQNAQNEIQNQEQDLAQSKCELCHTQFQMEFKIIKNCKPNYVCKVGINQCIFIPLLSIVLAMLLSIVILLIDQCLKKSNDNNEKGYLIALIVACLLSSIVIIILMANSIKKGCIQYSMEKWIILDISSMNKSTIDIDIAQTLSNQQSPQMQPNNLDIQVQNVTQELFQTSQLQTQMNQESVNQQEQEQQRRPNRIPIQELKIPPFTKVGNLKVRTPNFTHRIQKIENQKSQIFANNALRSNSFIIIRNQPMDLFGEANEQNKKSNQNQQSNQEEINQPKQQQIQQENCAYEEKQIHQY